MSKQKKKLKTASRHSEKTAVSMGGSVTGPDAERKIKIRLGIVVAIFAFVLYAQTISFSYAYDDYTVIVENTIVKKGIEGIPELLKTDYWYGFNEGFAKEEKGLIYRPASLVLFALEWEFFPDNPAISHFINVLIYAITCLLLFLLVCRIFGSRGIIAAFICTMLYAAHPLHTEVVSNIKSRDELLCFLFAIISLLFFSTYYFKNKVYALVAGGVFFFLSVLSKETGITFLVIIPLSLFIINGFNLRRQSLAVLTLSIFTFLFFFIRYRLNIGVDTGGQIAMFTNVMAGAESTGDRLATAFFILGKYIGLLLFPHPLVSDYSYAQTEIKSLANPVVLFSIVLYVAAGIYAVLNIRKRSMVAFAILFYLFTLSPVSNILFLIGSTMAERFMYIPSLGFCILLTLLLLKIAGQKQYVAASSLSQFFSKHATVFFIMAIIVLCYSVKTFSRSSDWKNNLSLFEKDSQTSPKSSRMHYGYGTALMRSVDSNSLNLPETNEIYDRAKAAYERALEIYPEYANAYLALGLIAKNRKDYKEAVVNMEKGQAYYSRPNSNMYRDIGYVYLKNGQFEKSLAALDSFLLTDTATADILNNKGSALFGLKKYADALAVFMNANKMNPNDIEILKNIGRCHIYLKQYDKAEEYFKRILAMEPGKSENYQFLGLTYQLMNDSARGNPLMRQYEAMKAAERK